MRLHSASQLLHGTIDVHFGALVMAAHHVAHAQRFRVSPDSDSPASECTLTFAHFVALVVRCDLTKRVEFNLAASRRAYTVTITRPQQLAPVLGRDWDRAQARHNNGRVEATFPLTITYSHRRPNVFKVVFDGFRRLNCCELELWNSSKRKRKQAAAEREAKRTRERQ